VTRRIRRPLPSFRSALAAGAALTIAIAAAAAAPGPTATDPPAPEALPPVPALADALDTAAPDAVVPSPAQHLGRRLGARFTRHHEMVEYFETLAAASDRVRLLPYGRSEQGRRLFVAVISAPDHLARLDEIRRTNAALADPERTSAADARRLAAALPATVWLSYNVHGNEPSCTEAAMQVAWRLASSTAGPLRDALDETVVVIDPCLNPDGRERYVSFFEQTVGRFAHPDPVAAEHREPWPAGRANHYLFDLNRDWV